MISEKKLSHKYWWWKRGKSKGDVRKGDHKKTLKTIEVDCTVHFCGKLFYVVFVQFHLNVIAPSCSEVRNEIRERSDTNVCEDDDVLVGEDGCNEA